MKIALAGTSFELRSSSERILAAARDHFRGFESDAPASWTVDLDERGPLTIGGEAGVLVGARHDGRWTFTLKHEISMRVDPITRTAHAALGAVPELFPPGSVQNLLRILLVLELAPKGGVLLHASATSEGAIAFFGPSGAGKSTLARGFAEGTLLSDEIVCVDGAGLAHRAPFTGEHLPPRVPLAVPLRALVAIDHGDSLRLSRLAPNDALRRLLPCVVNVATDRTLTAQIFDNAAALVRRVPTLRAALPRLPDDPGATRAQFSALLNHVAQAVALC
ncbi:MAG: hypothetical protein IT381_17630 [Deltaproteobacteria bacterium]|nr:hypothetical protein [Deltaproteobacteria bacterium]